MLTRDFGESGPPLAVGFVFLIAITYTLAYVLPFYFTPTTRPSPTLSRDSPTVIRARIRLVSSSCALCLHATTLLLRHYCSLPLLLSLQQTGLYPIPLLPSLPPLLLTALLFSGPLFERAIIHARWRSWLTGTPLLSTLQTWPGWRNFVAGPATEELLFRGALVPLFLQTRLSPAQVVWLAPLPFGLAHVHHAYELRLTHPGAAWGAVVVQSVFQFGYTTVFGWFAAFVLVRTGSLWACVGCHAFCNWMGLPRVWGRVGGGGEWVWEEGPEGGAGEVVLTGGKEGVEVEGEREREGRGRGRWVKVEGRRTGVGWTVAYYLLLVAGAVGFWKGLWVLTESDSALATF